MLKRFLAVAVLVLSACGGDSTGPSGETNAAGTYTLRTVNGQSLPFTLLQVGTTYRLDVTAGSINLNGNGQYNTSLTMRETNGGTTVTQTDTEQGTWTRANNALVFTATNGATGTSSLSENTITTIVEGATLVFRK